MNISSFLYIFFLFIVIFVDFLLPKQARWAWLLISSYLFCLYANIESAVVLLLVTIISFAGGYLIFNNENRKTKRIYLFAFIILVLLPLFITKYLNLSLLAINDSFNGLVPAKDFIISSIVVPLGVSFYTLQAFSYLMDIYNGVIQPEKHFGHYALYLAFFPKLISGPIERGGFLLPQISQPKPYDYQRLVDGLMRIALGFIKKLIVADRLGVIVNAVFDSPENYYHLSPILILAVFSFSMQVYIDFSAYTDIAIGSAKIFGFDLTENFNLPYLATSVTEFWRRWHISFTSWLRDYIFIPLNFETRRKRSKIIPYLNIVVVFLISGIWHGASITFIIWGLLHGVFQAIEAITLKFQDKIGKRITTDRSSFGHQFFQITRTFLLVTFAWIFFRANNLNSSINIIKSIFTLDGFTAKNGWNFVQLGLSRSNLSILTYSLAIILIFDIMNQKHDLLKKISYEPILFRWLVYLLLIFGVIIFGYFGAYTAESFIYAGF